MERRSGVIHAVGECRDCGKIYDHYKNAVALSAKHAKNTGHTVDCEQLISITYNPKD